MTFASHAAEAAPARQLLIYYADETTPEAANSANDAALLAILRRSHSALAAEVASSITKDAQTFPALVKADVAALSAASRRQGFDLVIFTNALALNRQFEVLRAGATTFEVHDLPALPPAANTILATSPLSRADYFAASLDAAAGLFPREPAVLIANSHGDEDMALTPRVFADLSFARAGEVLTELDRAPASGGERPRWAREQGVAKADFWRILGRVAQAHGTRFVLVFRDACRSGAANLSELLAVPPSVAAIANTGDDNIDEDAIDYAPIFGGSDQSGDIDRELTIALRRRGVYVDGRLALWLRTGWDALLRRGQVLFFLPLAVWIVWMGWSFFARRQAGASAQASAA